VGGISASCGESRTSGLWGSSRGGNGGRRGAKRRALLAIALLALGAPLAAGADNKDAHAGSYLAPALTQVAQSTLIATCP
jgi:hypothetical protein